MNSTNTPSTTSCIGDIRFSFSEQELMVEIVMVVINTIISLLGTAANGHVERFAWEKRLSILGHHHGYIVAFCGTVIGHNCHSHRTNLYHPGLSISIPSYDHEGSLDNSRGRFLACDCGVRDKNVDAKAFVLRQLHMLRCYTDANCYCDFYLALDIQTRGTTSKGNSNLANAYQCELFYSKNSP